MTELAEPAGMVPRAFLSVGGRTIAQHQLSLALALECRRIICLTRDAAPGLIALKATAEDAGAQVHTIQDGSVLPELVGSSDELLVFADGLLADPREAVELIEPSGGVLVQPAETGLPAGFERVDFDRATGGIMRIPGKLAERLAELPSDYDPGSSLIRIALQAGVPMREIPEAAREGGRWRLVRSEAEAQALDRAWVALALGKSRYASPSEMLARFLIDSFGASLLKAGSDSRILAIGVAVLLLLSLVVSGVGAFASGLALLAFANIVGRGTLLLVCLERGALEGERRVRPLGRVLAWLIDAVLLALLIWGAPEFPGTTLVGRAFAPLVLVCQLRMVPHIYEPRHVRWLGDRSLVAVLLAAAAALGLLAAGVELLALLLLGSAALHLRAGSASRRAA